MKNADLALAVLPRSFRRTLPYAETFTLTTGTAGVLGTAQLMLLNSLYDPNSTGTGHQPYGFDQLSSWFKTYIVHAVRVKILACSIGGSAEVAICWKFDTPSGFQSMAGYTVDQATEAPMIGVGLLGASGIDRVFKKTIDVLPHKVLGITKPQYVNEISSYGAAYNANPSLCPTLQLAIGSYTGTAGENASVQLVLEFDAEFFNPTELAQS